MNPQMLTYILYGLVLVCFLFSLIVSAGVDSDMAKFHKVANSQRKTGAEIAREILASAGIYHVQVCSINKKGGDCYDPRSKTVYLSEKNFRTCSVTAMAVAAHECGHAIQDHTGDTLFNARIAIVPLANIGSKAAVLLILAGLILSQFSFLITIGLLAYSLTTLFYLVTLPVELDASRRALAKIDSLNMAYTQEERKGCKKVLHSAAMTYVVATLTSIVQLLYMISRYSGRRR